MVVAGGLWGQYMICKSFPSFAPRTYWDTSTSGTLKRTAFVVATAQSRNPRAARATSLSKRHVGAVYRVEERGVPILYTAHLGTMVEICTRYRGEKEGQAGERAMDRGPRNFYDLRRSRTALSRTAQLLAIHRVSRLMGPTAEAKNKMSKSADHNLHDF